MPRERQKGPLLAFRASATQDSTQALRTPIAAIHTILTSVQKHTINQSREASTALSKTKKIIQSL